MGCPLWVQIRINVLHRTRILITDTSWLVRKGDTSVVPFEFKILLIYYITKGSSQQSPHSSSVRAIHGVSPMGSNSDWCITSLHKQRVLTPGHPGWNDLHSLCRIGMEYYLLNNDDNNIIYWIMMIMIIMMMMIIIMIIRMTMMIMGTTTIMIMIIIITTTLTMTIMKMIMIKTAQTPCQSLYKDRRI